MGGLRYGDVHEPIPEGECLPCAKERAMLCPHWRLKPKWKIWVCWLLRLLGWDGEPS